MCFSSDVYPTAFNSTIVKHLLKKSTLDCEVFKKLSHILELPFLSKLTEKVIAQRLVSHMQDTSVVEKFQLVLHTYKAHHSTETALLRVFNDILFSIDQGGGEILVLLDLSSTFDTIDHVVLFDLWQDTFGISGTKKFDKQKHHINKWITRGLLTSINSKNKLYKKLVQMRVDGNVETYN